MCIFIFISRILTKETLSPPKKKPQTLYTAPMHQHPDMVNPLHASKPTDSPAAARSLTIHPHSFFTKPRKGTRLAARTDGPRLLAHALSRVSTKSHVTRKQSRKEQENKGITNCRAIKTDSRKNNQNTAQENKGEKSSKNITYSTSGQPVNKEINVKLVLIF
jgi:hypothetical protein